MSTPLEHLNSRVFREQLHTKFIAVSPTAPPVTLELVEVLERDDSPQMELFALHWLGPITPRLAQQTHRLDHEVLGSVEIFLTPISADQMGTLYEAIFHRFRSQP